jgi:hypothetical protein
MRPTISVGVAGAERFAGSIIQRGAGFGRFTRFERVARREPGRQSGAEPQPLLIGA